jgi:hypothetical protein
MGERGEDSPGKEGLQQDTSLVGHGKTTVLVAGK